jgi:hypothetical protein
MTIEKMTHVAVPLLMVSAARPDNLRPTDFPGGNESFVPIILPANPPH